jgi:hypothetical protein
LPRPIPVRFVKLSSQPERNSLTALFSDIFSATNNVCITSARRNGDPGSGWPGPRIGANLLELFAAYPQILFFYVDASGDDRLELQILKVPHPLDGLGEVTTSLY